MFTYFSLFCFILQISQAKYQNELVFISVIVPKVELSYTLVSIMVLSKSKNYLHTLFSLKKKNQKFLAHKKEVKINFTTKLKQFKNLYYYFS